MSDYTAKYSAPSGLAVGKVVNTDDVYAQFIWNKDNTDYLEVEWTYATGNIYSDGTLKWFNGSTNRIDGSEWVEHYPETGDWYYRNVYSPPDNAVKVSCRVRAYSTSRSVTVDKKTQSYPYWTSSWSGWVTYSLKTKPNAPTVTAELAADGKSVKLVATDLATGTGASGREVYWQKAIDSNPWYYDHTDKNSGASTVTVRDYDIEPGHKYWYRACHRITAPSTNYYYMDWSPYSESATVITVPAPPSSTLLKAASETSATLRWKSTSWVDSYTVEWSSNPDAWDLHAEGDIETAEDVTATVYTATGLETGRTWYMRVRGVNETGEGKLSEKKGVVLGTVPTAPTTYATPTAVAQGESVRLRWTHNSEDGSDQSAADVEWSTNGGSSWSSASKTTQSEHTLSTSGFADGATVMWKVRTKGVLNTWSPFSEARTFRVWSQPSLAVSLTGPGGEPVDAVSSPLLAMPLTITLDAQSPSQSAVCYDVEIRALRPYSYVDARGEDAYVPEGAVVWSAHLTEPTVEVGWGDCALSGGIDYEVSAVAAMDSGLRAESPATGFSCEWDGSVPEPSAEIVCYRGTYVARIWPRVAVQVDVGVFEYPDVELAVWRVEADGRMVRLAYGLPNDGSAAVLDPHPAFGNPVWRIVATDPETGATSVVDETTPFGVSNIVVQWDERWRQGDAGTEEQDSEDYAGSMLELPYDIRVQEQASRDKELVGYAGNSSPTVYYGTQAGVGAVWTADVNKPKQPEKIDALRRLMSWMGEAYVREPDGSGYWADVDVSTSWGYDGPAASVTLTVTRTDTTDGV